MAIFQIKWFNLQPEMVLNAVEGIARYRVPELFAVLLQQSVRVDPALAAWLFG